MKAAMVLPIQQAAAGLSLGTGDKTAWVALEKLKIVEIGILVATTALTNTPAALVLKFDKIPNTGGSRGNGDVGQVTKTTNIGVGRTLMKKVDVQLEKGDIVVAEVTTAPTAGAGYPYIVAQSDGAGLTEPADVASA